MKYTCGISRCAVTEIKTDDDCHMQQISFESNDIHGYDHHGLRCQIHSLLAFISERSPGEQALRKNDAAL